MGTDDRNEGHEFGACVEHVWKLRGATFDLKGAQLDSECLRCGALMID